ncbi:MAG: hypothetical protein JWN95_1268 [Frankiales bacterium]|nr:hypothetical protein [Frankiales bacterium]
MNAYVAVGLLVVVVLFLVATLAVMMWWNAVEATRFRHLNNEIPVEYFGPEDF